MNTARDRVPIGPALPSAFPMRQVPCWGLGRGLRDVQPRLGISAGHDNRKILVLSVGRWWSNVRRWNCSREATVAGDRRDWPGSGVTGV